MKTLTFRHILFLHIMSLLQEPPFQGMLPSNFFESAYNWLEENGVTPNYTRKFRQNMKFYSDSCELLSDLGMIEKAEKQNKGYLLTFTGKQFLSEAGEDWREWPLFVDVSPDGQFHFDDAVYVQDKEPIP